MIIDEASQASEPATLVPITQGCEQLVLVGDHYQLPPTIKSYRAAQQVCSLTTSWPENCMSLPLPFIPKPPVMVQRAPSPRLLTLLALPPPLIRVWA